MLELQVVGRPVVPGGRVHRQRDATDARLLSTSRNETLAQIEALEAAGFVGSGWKRTCSPRGHAHPERLRGPCAFKLGSLVKVSPAA